MCEYFFLWGDFVGAYIPVEIFYAYFSPRKFLCEDISGHRWKYSMTLTRDDLANSMNVLDHSTIRSLKRLEAVHR